MKKTAQQNFEVSSTEIDVIIPEIQAASHMVYHTFYERFRDKASSETDGEPQTLLVNGRVLHFDDSKDRSTHLIVRENFADIVTSRGRQDSHEYTYDPDGYEVATTDGVNIRQWSVEHAWGFHDGAVDAITRKYNAQNEVMQLIITDQGSNRRAHLLINRADGSGTVKIDGRLGWILQEHESQIERDTALQPQQITDGFITDFNT